MKTLSRLFTLWYIKRGYTFGYDFTDTFVYTDGVLKSPLGLPKSVFRCPFWVKPLLIFFSPSVYYAETIGRVVSEGFENGLRSEETLDQQFN